jgi:hypothetical protein
MIGTFSGVWINSDAMPARSGIFRVKAEGLSNRKKLACKQTIPELSTIFI